jgi:4-amino-4-deoxy-L-arabinose transferase-like glycosyltransferase
MSQSSYFFSDRRAHCAALVTVIVTAAALRFYLFGGYNGLDDAEYAHIGYQIANGTFSLKEYGGPGVFPLRVGLILPTSLFFRMFGLSEWNMVSYPFILSVLALPLIYICTTCFFSHRAGVIAVALLGITPMELDSATKLVPDMPAAFFAAMGVTAIALVSRWRTERGSFLFWGGCLAGISFGLSWLCKEAISYLAPFCLAYMAISVKQNGRAALALWTGVAAGSIGILLGEMITYHSVAGDPLFRFHEIERNYRQLENGFFTEGSDFGWQKGESHARAIVKRLFVSGPNLILLNNHFLFLPLIGLIAAFHGWYSKDKSFLIPSLWLIALVLMFNFSSSSLSTYMPLALFSRYFYLIIFPSIVLASGFIGKLVFEGVQPSPYEVQRERRFWGIWVAISLLLMGAYHVQGSLRSTPSAWASEVRGLHSIIKPSSPLYTDTLSGRGFEFFWGYPKKTEWTDFANVVSPDEIRPGSLVLVNRAYIDWLDKNGGMWLSPRTGYRKHEFYQNPPPYWKKIWQNGNAHLYRVE